MISVIGLKTSSSTQMYITNATTKKCVTSSAILPRGLVNFVLMCRLMLATLIPATTLPHEGARFLLEKSPISFSAIDKLQSTIEKCFLVPGGFKPKKECVDQRNFKNIVD